MSLTSGLIPIGSKPSVTKSSIGSYFDFDVNDDDLEDLLELDTNIAHRTTTSVSKGSNGSFGKFNLKSSENVPASHTSFPKSSAKETIPIANSNGFKFTVDPALTKTKKDQGAVDEKAYNTILSSLGNMDDMDNGLFSSTGLIPKKSAPKTTAEFSVHESQTRQLSPTKELDSWSVSTNENAPKDTDRNNVASHESALFDISVRQTASKSSKETDLFGNDDLFTILGLDDKPAKSTKNSVLSNKQYSISTEFKSPVDNIDSLGIPKQLKPSIENTEKQFHFSNTRKHSLTSTPTTNQFTTNNDHDHQTGSPNSIVSIKSKEDEFIPSFLAEASGRRRRGPTTSITNTPKDDLNLDPSVLHQNPFKTERNAVANFFDEELSKTSNVKKNPLIASVSTQISRPKPTGVFGTENFINSDTNALPFLNQKLSFLDEKKANIPTVTQSQWKFSNNPTKNIHGKLLTENPKVEQKSTLSKSSSLSSLVSLSHTEDEAMKEDIVGRKPNNSEKSTTKKKISSIFSNQLPVINQISAALNHNEISFEPLFAQLGQPAPETISTAADSTPVLNPSNTTPASNLTEQVKELKNKLEKEELKFKNLEAEKNKIISENAILKTSLEFEQAASKNFKEKFHAIESQVSADNENIEQLRKLLIESHNQEISILKETHSFELEHVADSVKAEISKFQAEQDKTIALIKSKHFDEMCKLISTADAAQQLESLTQKMEESSRLVDHMHRKLESDHSYSVKEREMALQLKERQLVELQRQITKQRQDLEDEQTRLKHHADGIDATLEQYRKDREDDQRVSDEERRTLENQINLMKTEKDLIQRQLHRERLEFVRLKESWSMERRRILLLSSDEQKDLAMEKAILEAKREAVAEIELEMKKMKSREEAQILADRMVLDKEIHEISIKKGNLHREAAHLRAERISLESEKQNLAAELEAFENGWKTAENRFKQAKFAQETAGAV
ncbi:hypothetical protein HK100_006641 [Physocladia obscura]|uniref:Fas-binding factor 1 C-terminal domain-containing protein n=1 Tax=Physocladia obscura TaxID=109957 RepID=A0AAD5T5R3_9FUNG|nr:hypothetical protein HK100_006641 [Physocladia obscura]